ncbi:MAG: tripartite tricarboxylate transporter TctB family protein [Oscillospiraceae bacterium]
MEKKKANIITHVAIILMSAYGVFNMFQLKKNGGGDSSIFPVIICVSLIILSVISLLFEMKKESTVIVLGDLKLIFITILVLALYLLVWIKLQCFYIATGCFVFGLYWLYSKDRKDYKSLLKKGIPVTACTLIFVYALFEKAMSIRF